MSSLTGDVSTLTQTSMGLSSQVSSLDGSVSSQTQTVAGLSLSVSNGSDSSTISLMQNGVAISSKTVQITGMVTFSDLSRSGGTTINGANITTGSINASLITTGTLSSNYIRLYDSMAVYSGSSIAGYIGYTTSANDGSSGVHLKNGLGEVVATSSGAKLTYNGTTNQIYIGNGNAGVTVSGVSYMFQTGAFRPITSGGPMLGTSAALWGQIYSTNSAVSTSDRNKKNTIEDLDERYLALIERVRCRRFKFNDGTSDRFHPGFVSQDVEEDLAAVGLDSQEFGGFVKDKDEDGNDIYFLRYEEFIAPLVAKVQEMDKRLKKLEVSA